MSFEYESKPIVLRPMCVQFMINSINFCLKFIKRSSLFFDECLQANKDKELSLHVG